MFSFLKKKPAFDAGETVFVEVAFTDLQTQPVQQAPADAQSAPPPVARVAEAASVESAASAAPVRATPIVVEPSAAAPASGAVSERVAEPVTAPEPSPAPHPAPSPAAVSPAAAAEAPRQSWIARLRAGLRKTGQSLAAVFSRTQIDDALYEELEEALLLADTGVKATQFLLEDLRRRVREARCTDPQAVKTLLVEALAELLQPLERPLEIGRHEPTVMMVVGVNGAGKTTSIGKLTRHLLAHDQKVLLAAADTFRAAAREQLAVWADRADGAGLQQRGQVDIISQQGGDPAAVSFDAVNAGKARGCDVVIADTAGRLPTQLHLMEELKKIRRVITKAQADAPHEVLLVVDGNTGQNALAQVRAFDDALQLTGLVVTKLDGTAKGGVLAAIARERPVPVYFIGVGEKLEDLQTFSAREFAQALLH
jgi:fused signal recognition particle receptor